MNIAQLVIPYKQHASTTSRLIATKFNKRHADVLRAIRELECSSEFRERNFALSLIYRDMPNGGKKQEEEYIISRDGFVFLVMGFAGDQAAKFKEEYLAEFNRMEAILLQQAAPKLIPVYSQRVLSEPTKSVPRGYWSVFDKAHSIMLLIETKVGSINKYDLVDGSIGKMWANYRKGQFWADMEPGVYNHEYDDNRGSVECKCYHGSELQYFDEWLQHVYKVEHLRNYLVNKYKKEGNRFMLDRVEMALPKQLRRSA